MKWHVHLTSLQMLHAVLLCAPCPMGSPSFFLVSTQCLQVVSPSTFLLPRGFELPVMGSVEGRPEAWRWGAVVETSPHFPEKAYILLAWMSWDPLPSHPFAFELQRGAHHHLCFCFWDIASSWLHSCLTYHWSLVMQALVGPGFLRLSEVYDLWFIREIERR